MIYRDYCFSAIYYQIVWSFLTQIFYFQRPNNVCGGGRGQDDGSESAREKQWPETLDGLLPLPAVPGALRWNIGSQGGSSEVIMITFIVHHSAGGNRDGENQGGRYRRHAGKVHAADWLDQTLSSPRLWRVRMSLYLCLSWSLYCTQDVGSPWLSPRPDCTSCGDQGRASEVGWHAGGIRDIFLFASSLLYYFRFLWLW